jgi:hypothetical protein
MRYIAGLITGIMLGFMTGVWFVTGKLINKYNNDEGDRYEEIN